MKDQQIPIDQLLMIREITPVNILKLHSEPERIKVIRSSRYQIKITKISSSAINGYIKTNYGVFSTQFDTDLGIRCSCGFDNGISDNFANKRFSFEFCDHITAFLLYLIELPDRYLQKYVNDIVPKSVRNQYVLNYLFDKGLIFKNDTGTISCSQFGKLIIRLYLYPVSGVLIRQKLENKEINTYQDLIKEAFEILNAEGRVKDYKMIEPIMEWTDEEPLEKILDRFKIMAGDYSKNHIAEIKSLEDLKNLKGLDLSNNQIREIKGLENLSNLQYLKIHNNPLPPDLIVKLGGIQYGNYANKPKKFVDYCKRAKK